jgi:hypothetical protein
MTGRDVFILMTGFCLGFLLLMFVVDQRDSRPEPAPALQLTPIGAQNTPNSTLRIYDDSSRRTRCYALGSSAISCVMF